MTHRYEVTFKDHVAELRDKHNLGKRQAKRIARDLRTPNKFAQRKRDHGRQINAPKHYR